MRALGCSFLRLSHGVTVKPAIAEIDRLFRAKGAHAYGEGVSQLEHALQCGALAQAANASDELVLAAFLHDIGHFLHADAGAALQSGIDDRHEVLGAAWLAQHFSAGVWQPVALHVEAKRYLCAREAGYFAALSAASQASLQLQGGPLDTDGVRAFERSAGAQEAIQLRRWDDEGKIPQLATPDLAHFLALAEGCLIA